MKTRRINDDTVVGFTADGTQIKAEQLQRWAYDQLAGAGPKDEDEIVATITGDGSSRERYDIPTLKCHRCGHTWYPKTTMKPKVCPNRKCKSPYWDRPRKIKKEQEK